MADYFVRRQSKVFGPLTGQRIVDFAKAGKVRPTDEISADKTGPWKPATSLGPLQAVFKEIGAVPQPVQQQKTADWFYIKTGFVKDTTIGPVDNQQVVGALEDGVIKGKNLIASKTITNGEWIAVSQTPCYAVYEKLLAKRKEAEREDKRLAWEASTQASAERTIALGILRQELQPETQEQASAACGYCKKSLSGGESRCPHCTSFLEWAFCHFCSMQTCFDTKTVHVVFYDKEVPFCLMCGKDEKGNT